MDEIRTIVDNLRIYPHDDSRENEFTRDFGFVKFDDGEISTPTSCLSYYIHLALETPDKKIHQLFEQAFHLSKPNLIISITGGAKKCDLSPRLNRSFQQGLIQAAKTTNAWIITAGTDAGIVKQVGEALENYRSKNANESLDIPLIGISYWNYIQDHHLLEHNHSDSRASGIEALHQHNPLDELYNARSYVVGAVQSSCCALENHHSHFLLFDDHRSRDNPSEILQKRAQLEKSFQSYLSENGEKIPLVLILVEGGASSIRTICQALLEKTAVLVIDGSGRAANLLAELHRHFVNRSSDEQLDHLLEKSIERNAWLRQVKDELLKVFAQRWQLVSIYRLRGDMTFEEAILQTLFNATKYVDEENHKRVAQMKLAIRWNKIDYAKKWLDEEETLHWTTDDFLKCLYCSIVNNRIEFIDLLINNGISFDQLTIGDFHSLYTSTTKETIVWKKKSSTIFSRLRKDLYRNYLAKEISSAEKYNASTNLGLCLGQSSVNKLFLWALSVDRFDLAKYLSSKIWNPTFGCLLASRFYLFARQSATIRTKREIYQEKSLYFDGRAAKLIDQCFQLDESLAMSVIKSKATSFDNLSVKRLASESDAQAFLTSKAFQTDLKNRWFGHINYKANLIELKIFLCVIFFPLLPVFASLLPFHHKLRKVKRRNRTLMPLRIGEKKFTSYLDLSEKDEPSLFKKYLYFFQSPVVRFYNHGIFLCLFLFLFSYVALYEYDPVRKISFATRSSLSIPEIVLHIWIWTLLVEEIRQTVLLKSFNEYFADVWNRIDLIAFTIYLVSFSTRFIFNENFYLISKISFCICLIFYYIRLLHYFAAYEQLGPKLAMIYATMKDLVFFLCFIGIFIGGFSVCCISLLQTSKSVKWIYNDKGQLFNVTLSKPAFTWQSVQDLLSFGVWKVFAQVDPMEGDDFYSETVYLLIIIFVVLANVLLLNVLISLFSLTIENVQKDSYKLWRYLRFLLIQESALKSPVPPPFNVIINLFNLLYFGLKWIIQCLRRMSTRDQPTDGRGVRERFLDPENYVFITSFRVTDEMRRERIISSNLFEEEHLASQQ